MVTRQRGLVAIVGLVAFPALLLSVTGCTGSSGQPSPAGGPGAAAGGVCTRAEVKAAISGFFQAWNRRDTAALGRLFTVDGVLDMATKDQDTLTGQAGPVPAGAG
jgi:hypothetical protein